MLFNFYIYVGNGEGKRRCENIDGSVTMRSPKHNFCFGDDRSLDKMHGM